VEVTSVLTFGSKDPVLSPWIKCLIYFIETCCSACRPSLAWKLVLLNSNNWQLQAEITSSLPVKIFNSCCLVAASNGGPSPSSRFPNYRLLQVPVSHSSSSHLNPNSYTTVTLEMSSTYWHGPHRKHNSCLQAAA
jgi:hypothetical protein